MIRSLARVVKVLLVILLAAGASAPLLQAQLPQSIGTWVSRGAVAEPRVGAASIALEDGRTLIAGGRLADGSVTDSVAVYDPVANATTLAGQLFAPRVNAAATLLADGRVMISGGLVGGVPSADVEIFDLAAGTSAFAATMAEPRAWHASARLFDDTVLMVGGATTDGTALSSAEIFDPETGSIYPAGTMATPRAGVSATTMIDHRVLIAGGNDGIQDLASAEIYDAYTSVFIPVPTAMGVARSGHTAVLLPHNAGVLLAGGTAASSAVTVADVFLPAIFPDPYSWGMGSFAPTGLLTAPRAFAVGGPLGDNGFAYVAGGGAADAEAYRFATIKTDKDDYAPGEPATITGTGWQPGEEVMLTFQEDPAVHDDYSFAVTADASGNMHWDQWAPEEHDLGVRFYLTAQGSASRAQTTFTDAKGTNTTIVSSLNPAFVNQAVTFTASVTETGNGGGSTGAAVTVGSVTFRVGGTNCNTSTALSGALALNASGQVTLNTTFSTTGIRTIRACYAGTGGSTGTGNSDATLSQQVNADTTAPSVTSIVRTDASPINAAVAFWTVTFNENVTGVDAADFALAQTGLTGAPAVTGVTGGPMVYTVSADTGNGTGTLGLNLVDNDSILDAANNRLGGTGAGNGSFVGQVYAIDRTLTPTITAASKPYDGNSAATIMTRGFTSAPPASADVTLTGGTATFADANVGVGKTVTATGLGLSGADATRFVLSSTSATTTADISKINANVSVTGYDGVYDGAAHGATGTATGIGGVDLSAGLSLGASFTDVPGGTASWTFSGGTNYNDESGDAIIAISPAAATIVVDGYIGVYDATPHGASLGSAVGVGGANLGAYVTLGNETFTDVPGGTVNWSFAEPNYVSQSGTTAIVITPAAATVTVNGYTGTYDAAAHGATGTATGIGGVDLSAGLNLGATFTDVPGGTASWTFDGGTNYADQNGTAAIVITPAAATITVNGYTGVYDAAAHGATLVSAVGVSGADLTSSVTLGGETFTNVPGGTATWNFTNTNYVSQTGTADISITPATATVTVNGYTGVYDAAAHGATGTATGIGGLDLSAGLNLGATFTNVPGGTAAWTFDGGTNYADQNGTAAIVITARPLTVSATGVNKVYDGTVAATVTLTDNRLGSDAFTVSYASATFNNRNVGSSKPVQVTGIAITGAEAGNYSANTTATATANITQRGVTVTGITANNKPFDGNTTATLNLGGATLVGAIPGDAVTLNTSGAVGTFSSATVGSWPVAISGLTLSGADQGNYALTQPAATASITAWTLTGFYSPVGITNTYAGAPPGIPGVWNTIKGGQTVPFKFNLYATAGGAELTSIGSVQSFSLALLACTTGAEDPVEPDFTTTGSTSLRYGDGQFIQNWATPKGANRCYRVTMTAADGSMLSAFFKTK